jgi:hypothetical protein
MLLHVSCSDCNDDLCWLTLIPVLLSCDLYFWS